MNKTCARCSKVVYPLEELKCLEKSWHKTCFKCTECGMVLNMKTYKGFNKFPYCEAHIPKAKATTIADTPELKRIAENTKIQSNVQYHADFEKSKGKLTQVADDPETLRIKQNTKQISNVAYHGDLEKKAAMERQRETGEVTESRVSSANHPNRRVGSINDIDPVNGVYGSISMEHMQQQQQQQQYEMMRRQQQQQQQMQQAQQQQMHHQQQMQQQQPPRSQKYRIFRAVYDYEAKDADEVSFLEGDLIYELESIDAGWMTGRVERTGKAGMLPANYLELARI